MLRSGSYRRNRTRTDDADVDNATKLRTLQAWCAARQIGFHLIVNTEPGAAGGRGFHDGVMAYIRRLWRDGIFPDLFLIQSWYPQPAEHLPEDQPYSFAYTLREAIALIRTLYPQAP